MTIIITGGGGFLGGRLIAALLAARDSGNPAVPEFDRIVSLDIGPSTVNDPRIDSRTGDVADPAFIGEAVRGDVTAIYHLAAVVSSQAEADFDLGIRVNVDGLRILLEAARALTMPAKFIFASSLAVFGGELPTTVGDYQALVPSSSYGAQKAIGELLVSDYARRGYVDGVALRLPTVVVRPGKPNAAASSFASGIIREPLSNVEAVCPVPGSTRIWLASPDTVIANLIHALTLPPTNGGQAVNLPGISVTVDEMLGALQRVGGITRQQLVRKEPDQRVEKIVCSWPGDFDIHRALSLGFVRDTNFDAVVRQYALEFAPTALIA